MKSRFIRSPETFNERRTLPAFPVKSSEQLYYHYYFDAFSQSDLNLLQCRILIKYSLALLGIYNAISRLAFIKWVCNETFARAMKNASFVSWHLAATASVFSLGVSWWKRAAILSITRKYALEAAIEGHKKEAKKKRGAQKNYKCSLRWCCCEPHFARRAFSSFLGKSKPFDSFLEFRSACAKDCSLCRETLCGKYLLSHNNIMG